MYLYSSKYLWIKSVVIPIYFHFKSSKTSKISNKQTVVHQKIGAYILKKDIPSNYYYPHTQKRLLTLLINRSGKFSTLNVLSSQLHLSNELYPELKKLSFLPKFQYTYKQSSKTRWQKDYLWLATNYNYPPCNQQIWLTKIMVKPS